MPLAARHLPIVLFTTAFFALGVTFVLATALPHWWFGFAVPMFSFTGYDPPVCWWIFSLGLTSVAVQCAALGQVMHTHVGSVCTAVGLRTHGAANNAFRVLMFVASACLSALAWLDHRTFYKRGETLPHVLTTLVAFGGWLVSLLANYRITKACHALADASALEPLASVLRASLRRKRRGFTALGICLVVHIPLGYIIPHFPLCGDLGGCGANFPCNDGARCIHYDECEAITGLSPSQCAFWRSATNATLTELPWPETCAACDALNPLTALTQYLLIGCLMLCVSLFYHDLAHDPITGEKLLLAARPVDAL